MDVVNPSIEIDAADIFQLCTRPLKCGPASEERSETSFGTLFSNQSQR